MSLIFALAMELVDTSANPFRAHASYKTTKWQHFNGNIPKLIRRHTHYLTGALPNPKYICIKQGNLQDQDRCRCNTTFYRHRGNCIFATPGDDVRARKFVPLLRKWHQQFLFGCAHGTPFYSLHVRNRLAAVIHSDFKGCYGAEIFRNNYLTDRYMCPYLGFSDSPRFRVGFGGNPQRFPVKPQGKTEADNARNAEEKLPERPGSGVSRGLRSAPLGAKIAVITGPLIAAWIAFFYGLDAAFDRRRFRAFRLIGAAFGIAAVSFWLVRP